MVRSLTNWTKTLSFPARISPNKQTKENIINIHPISPTVTPTLSNNSLSKNNNNEFMNIMNSSPISEVSKVSCKSILYKYKNVNLVLQAIVTLLN